jgi:zinc protease
VTRADPFDRTVAPAVAQPAGLRMRDVERHVLSNGLETIVVPQSELPVVDVLLVLRHGAASDARGSEGLAAFTAEMVDEGTTHRSAAELADALEALGAWLRVDAGWDATTLSLHVLRPRLEAALALLAEVVTDAAFPEDEVPRKRAELLAALVRENDEPAVLASKAFGAIVYGAGHRYGVPLAGTTGTVAALQRGALVALHHARYRPARDAAFLVVAGAVEGGAAIAALERTLAAWSGVADAWIEGAPEAERRAAAIHIVDRPGAPQSEIRVGHAGPPRTTQDYFPLIVLNTMLGGSFTSRLNLKLREEKGYTYGARSGFAFRAGPGPFVASSAVFTDVTADAVSDFLNEMRRLQTEAVPADELERARRYLALGLPRRFETGEQIAAHLAEVELFGLGDGYWEQFGDRVAAVDAAAIARAAADHLDPAHAQVVIVGDRARIARDLERLDIGPVIDFAYRP